MKVQAFQLLRNLVVYVSFMTEDFVITTRFVKNLDLSDGKTILCSSSCGKQSVWQRKRWSFSHDRPQGRSECINKEGKRNACECTFTPTCSLHEDCEAA